MSEAELLQQVDRTWVRFRGRKLLYFSGCDYFRLASDPRVLAAVEASARRFGVNVAASRVTTGNHQLYAALERDLADFFDAEAAALTSTGYLTNLVVCQALAGEITHALIDRRSHPAVADAAKFLGCPVRQFHHRDPRDLAHQARGCGNRPRLLVMTDGMFSHDGSATPLQEYLDVLPAKSIILVDDAHGAGVLGGTGRGTLEHAGVGRDQVIQTITLSKAFGAYGGAIVGSAGLRKRVVERSHAFGGSTPLPLPLAQAALCSLGLFRKNHRRLLAQLRENAAGVKKALREAGFSIPDQPGPIIALHPRTAAAAERFRAGLLRAGILPPYLRYITGPAAGYFRFVISSAHKREQLDLLLNAVWKCARPADFTAG